MATAKVKSCVPRKGSYETDAFSLSRSGFSDFYFLPIRIMRVLGWVGGAVRAANLIDQPELISEGTAAALVKLIVTQYGRSIVAISDEQSPFYIAFATARDLLGCVDEAEIVSGLLFSSLCDSRGRLSFSGLSGSEALTFLEALAAMDFASAANTIARPTSFLPALILLYADMNIADVADRSMKIFDHVAINIFIPTTYRSFCEELIEEGTNYTYQIGHGIWRTEDLVREWHAVKGVIQADSAATRYLKCTCLSGQSWAQRELVPGACDLRQTATLRELGSPRVVRLNDRDVNIPFLPSRRFEWSTKTHHHERRTEFSRPLQTS